MSDPSGKFHGEQVLVVPTRVLEKALVNSNDFFPVTNFSSPSQIMPYAEFHSREDAENDESIRQIIPYVLIKRTVEGQKEYFLFKRLRTQGEERLHNLYSLGAGGHINPSDNQTSDPLEAGLMRELNEELFLPQDFCLCFKGWIFSTIDPVSRVHAGMVYLMDVIKGEIQIKERDKMIGSWCRQEELIKCYNSMEGWSRIVMDCIIRF